MEFEEKPEIKELVADDKLDHAIVEQELAPAIHAQFQEEPEQGPVPKLAADIAKPPDPSALAAWIDDIGEYTDSHRGDPKATELMDKLASGALDDVLGTARGHLKDDVTPAMEQKGMINDFHADSEIDGGALDTHQAEEEEKDDDGMPLRNKKAGHGDDDDDDGGDGGGGGGGGTGGPPAGGPGDGAPGEPGDPKDPKKKAADAKAADKDKKPDKPADKPADKDKAKRDDKKRDGER